MGIWDAFSEIVEAVTPWSVVEAEAPAEETQVGGMSFWEVRERQKQNMMLLGSSAGTRGGQSVERHRNYDSWGEMFISSMGLELIDMCDRMLPRPR